MKCQEKAVPDYRKKPRISPVLIFAQRPSQVGLFSEGGYIRLEGWEGWRLFPD